MLKTTENRYNGVIIDSTELPKNIEDFRIAIIKIIDLSKGKELLWINIPIQKSKYIPILTQLDFEFHHCDDSNLMLIKKLKSDSFIPTTKNYIVGVGAVVINNDQLLVVKDNFNVGYKLPGGHIDKDETLKDAVRREVAEETGINIEFESIMNLGHFLKGQFGESNIYIVCTAKALSYTINISDCSEILEAKWMDISEFLNSADVNDYNKRVVKAAINNKELKLTAQNIKLKVRDGEVFF